MKCSWSVALVACLALVVAACESGDGGDPVGGADVLVTDDAVDPQLEDVAASEPDVLAEPDGAVSVDVPAAVDVPPPPEDLYTPPAAPEVSFRLVPYTAISGVFPFDATGTSVTKVELLVDGAPAGELDMTTHELDTTTLPAGLHQLSVRGTAEDGTVVESTAAPAILAGAGTFYQFTDGWQEPTLFGGWSGLTLEVPEGATSVYDQKAHVTMPPGMHEVRAYLYWTATTPWSFGLDIGTGNCPDSGRKLAQGDLEAPAGPIEVVYTPGTELPSGKWFAHLRFKDVTPHSGESLPLSVLFLAVP